MAAAAAVLREPDTKSRPQLVAYASYAPDPENGHRITYSDTDTDAH